MGNFEVYHTLSILFELEKPLVEHFEGFILLPKKGDKLYDFFRTLNQKFQLKNSPRRSAKAGASMVGGMFVVVIMSC